MAVMSNPEKPIDIADPFARLLMTRYLGRRESDVQNLRQALRQADFETIRTTGHNMFGSGATYGLEEISSLGEKLEIAAEAGDSACIDGLIAELEILLGQLQVRTMQTADRL